MSVGRLNGSPKNARVQKSLITAKLSGITVDIDDEFKMGVTNKSEDYLKKFPLGQVPSFESNDGLLLTESNAIAFHLANLKDNNSLLGKNKNELAKIHQYSYFMEAQFMPHFGTIILPAFGHAPYNEANEKAAFEKLDKALAYLDGEIGDRPYLVGNTITLADILVGENLTFAYTYLLDEPYRAKFPHLTKYFTTYRQIPEVKAITGETNLKEEKFVGNPKKD